MTGGCRVEILVIEEVSRHIKAWSDLAACCLEPTVFTEPAFALAAARSIPNRPRPRFLLVWDPDGDGRPRLIGLCCLVGRFGFPPSCWLHAQATSAFPLLDQAEAPRALAAMLSWIAWRTIPSALFIQGLQEDGPTVTLLNSNPAWRVCVVERRTRAILHHSGPMPPLLARGDKELRRQARRLADRGAVAIESARSPEAVVDAVERFLELEAQGWKGRRGTALAQSRALAAFTRAMTRDLAQMGQCRVDILTVSGAAAAAGIVLRSGQRSFYWKTAFDESLRRLSPGVHLALAITAAQRAEPSSILTDSCATPDHAMIDRLWPDRMTVVDLVCGMAATPAWRFALATRLVEARRWTWLRLKRSRQALRRLSKRGGAWMP